MRTPVAHPGKPCPLPIRPAALDHRPAGNAARPAGPVWPFDPFAPLHPGSAAGRRPSFTLATCCRSCRSAGPAPAAVVDPATLAAAALAMAAAMVRRGRRAAALATITPRSTPHITPPQHHAGGPPAPGSNTVGVAFIATRCTITLRAHPR